MWQTLHKELMNGNIKALARSISLVENEASGFEDFLMSLKANKQSKLVGITGAPGAGKSTLVDALISETIKENKRIAVLCIDPSSPFHFGALLGDRIRMSQWYDHPNVFIRSLATRGSLGGLHPKIIEITSLLAAAGFDYIFIETVGVGQSEVEIAGLADTTIVVLVPESGDDIQSMKAGLMEIADIFVVNKSDRPGADVFVKNLQQMLPLGELKKIPIIKTIAHEGNGIEELMKAVKHHSDNEGSNEKKAWLFTERVYQLIQKERMKTVNKKELKLEIEKQMGQPFFNIYHFAKNHL